jgi:hypothetical protein
MGASEKIYHESCEAIRTLSGDPDIIDKLVALTFGNMACDATLERRWWRARAHP